MKILGLVVANGLCGLSGALLAQQLGYSDITLGPGSILTGPGRRSSWARRCCTAAACWPGLVGAVLGSVVFQLIIAADPGAAIDHGSRPTTSWRARSDRADRAADPGSARAAAPAQPARAARRRRVRPARMTTAPPRRRSAAAPPARRRRRPCALRRASSRPSTRAASTRCARCAEIDLSLQPGEFVTDDRRQRRGQIAPCSTCIAGRVPVDAGRCIVGGRDCTT